MAKKSRKFKKFLKPKKMKNKLVEIGAGPLLAAHAAGAEAGDSGGALQKKMLNSAGTRKNTKKQKNRRVQIVLTRQLGDKKTKKQRKPRGVKYSLYCAWGKIPHYHTLQRFLPPLPRACVKKNFSSQLPPKPLSILSSQIPTVQPPPLYVVSFSRRPCCNQ